MRLSQLLRRLCCCKRTDGGSQQQQQSKTHFYCGCHNKFKRKMATVLPNLVSGSDKAGLVSQGADALQYDYQLEHTPESWDLVSPTLPLIREFCDHLEVKRNFIFKGSIHHDALRHHRSPFPMWWHAGHVAGPPRVAQLDEINLSKTVTMRALEPQLLRWKRLTLNLCAGGEGELSNIVFHFNPRFDQNYVARNCRLNGHWGCEEAQGNNPFRRGDTFIMQLFLTHNEFLEVAVNGRHYCTFAYRAHISTISRLEVHGDVDLQQVLFNIADTFPSQLAEYGQLVTTISVFHDEQTVIEFKSQETPMVGRFHPCLGVGHQLEIVGRVKLLPHSLTVNLQQGDTIWPHPLINLHVNARFKEATIVCNTWPCCEGTGWGSEEILTLGDRFVPGRTFHVGIGVAERAFVVSVDGARIHTFQHRLDAGCIDTLYIDGDVFVNQIHVM